MARQLIVPSVTLILLSATGLGLVPGLAAGQGVDGRVVHSLNGAWELKLPHEESWKSVSVPGTFEDQIDVDFDGTAILRRSIEPMRVGTGQRLVLHFDAVATHAKVWFNDVLVGEHLGGWTPFRLDVTDAARARADRPWEVRVEVDERVGHNTQGFLPVIAPHFGGVWQGVELIEVSRTWIDETGMFQSGNLAERTIHLEIPLVNANRPSAIVAIRCGADGLWTTLDASEAPSLVDGQLSGDWLLPPENECENFTAWSTENPSLYALRVMIADGDSTDMVTTRVAFRDVRVEGDGFLLNGRRLQIRGLLNWGYAPPRTAPSIDEDFMRQEIEFARSRGFNLMKFCLWIPPTRYLDLCDEGGMLAWIEYPTWHPDFSPERLAELQSEYEEFFRHDRNHPSVILRSLTCETGPSADLGVIRALYDRCKEHIPDAIVVDDSSWIEWNRVFDFYDDHPYGNNHTWVAELTRLRDFIRSRETKPLVLGEAIAADTWTPVDFFQPDDMADSWHRPDFLQSSRQWYEEVADRYGISARAWLEADSRTVALLTRKFQIETFRREFPRGGYVVSVIRDFRKAAMGLIDYRGQTKWEAGDWSWHGDDMLLLVTDGDQRAFEAGSEVRFNLLATRSGGDQDKDLVLECSAFTDDGERIRAKITEVPGDTNFKKWFVDFRFPIVETPTSLYVVAVAGDGKGDSISNNWPIWLIPRIDGRKRNVSIHSSATGMGERLGESGWTTAEIAAHRQPKGKEPILTRVVDESILERLAGGGSVLLIPDNQPGSFPLRPHWFLRGGPVLSERFNSVGPTDSDEGWLGPRQMLVELQTFDLAADVIPDLKYLDQIDPLFMLWESHDLEQLKTNGLVFQLPVGEQGRLLVSALRHEGENNPAGRFLLDKMLVALSDGEVPRRDESDRRGQANLEGLRREIAARRITLEARTWKFRPDPDSSGADEGWFDPDLDEHEWSEIGIDRHWESQGNETLDGWAWYRLEIVIPEDWPVGKSFLNFTGVDDYYDLYVNGEKVGSGGDLEKRETAFDLKTSHDLSANVRPGESLTIAVAVYDWYGAGGIFRPVEISTEPGTEEKKRMLR